MLDRLKQWRIDMKNYRTYADGPDIGSDIENDDYKEQSSLQSMYGLYQNKRSDWDRRC